MEEHTQNRKYLPLLWAVNLAVAAFFAASYLWFTSDMALRGAGAGGSVLLTYEGGWKQALYRYGGMSIAVIVLQGLLYVLNGGIVPFLEPDGEKITPTCLKMALASTLLIMAITLAALALGWPSPN